MALTDENMVMPVTPMNSGNNGFGGDFFGGNASWIIIFLFLAMFGGWAAVLAALAAECGEWTECSRGCLHLISRPMA